MANHKKTEYSARLKKFYSTMSNAIKLAETEEGIPASEWDYSLTTIDFFNRYLAKYISCNWIKVQFKEVNEGGSYRGGYIPTDKENGSDACVLNDGTFFVFYVQGDVNGNGDGTAWFNFDLNGNKGPNKEGSDVYQFLMGKTCMSKNNCFVCDGFTVPSIDGCDLSASKNREWVKRYCEGGAYSCARLLFLDSWEFKDDYPYRL